METAIKVRGLNFSYGGNILFENADLDVNKGDFVLLSGANGTGKSTFLKLLLGELKLSLGKMELFGESVNGFSNWQRIGYVQQMTEDNFPSFPISSLELVLLNLYDKMNFFKIASKKNKEEALRVLELVGLSDFSKELFGNLSGGQKQRVMIAKALVNNPDLLIFDEPISGMDEKNRNIIFDFLKIINIENSITVFIVSHEIEFLKKYINKIFKIQNKKISEEAL